MIVDYQVVTVPRVVAAPVSTGMPIQLGQGVIVGPPGPAGPAGNSTYQIFEFINASSVWTINHTLGRYPMVTILNAQGEEVWSDIDRPSLSQVVITFANPQTGKVFIS